MSGDKHNPAPFQKGGLEQDIFEWLQRKYVQRADERQKSLGLVYMSAETHDLAIEIARCARAGSFE